ncbi:MAG TPA: hypothetical protein VHR72_04010, partial [Gemmataceae bacterium]|nr:hypothetical protein [Gemmataceae bacterium]
MLNHRARFRNEKPEVAVFGVPRAVESRGPCFRGSLAENSHASVFTPEARKAAAIRISSVFMLSGWDRSVPNGSRGILESMAHTRPPWLSGVVDRRRLHDPKSNRTAPFSNFSFASNDLPTFDLK